MIGKEELDAVTRVMNRGILSQYQGNWSSNFYGGEEIKALEREWASYFGVKHAIAVNSATSGLWCALNATDINGIGMQENWKPEIIVTPYSMTCSASLPLLFDITPIFADIEYNYFCLDPESIESRIGPCTKAIVVVDLFGQPYNADEINRIAKKYNLIIIEDASQAPGAKYKGSYTGTLGDIGVYSLNFHKHIHCGEGGIVVTNNDDLAFKIRLSLNHAEAVINDIGTLQYAHMIGMNLRMTELSAAIAREQLKKLKDILKVYREDKCWFNVDVRPDCEHSFYRYAWHIDKTLSRPIPDTFMTKRGYITPLFKLPLFRQLGYDQTQCPVVQEVEKNIILAWRKDHE